ncbi:hypothetical protein ACGFZB_39195 [Streptomyces cinerochromogenes]|uniref:Preprotein translocase subunit TatA n=1 Tax=Streptomyces cinerochromogenes TaxID=66422 RepID=A0ABW7BGP6_9ACTN
MDWDAVLLFILAFSGAVSLLLAQIDDVLDRLPRIIRAWRRVRQELDGGSAEPPDAADGRARLAPSQPSEEADGTTTP